MAFVKMKPPAGITVGLGPVTDKVYTVDAQGFFLVDSTDVSGLTSAGWASVTDQPAGNPDNIVRATTDLTGGITLLLGDSRIDTVQVSEGSNLSVEVA